MARGVMPLTGAIVAVWLAGVATAQAQITLSVLPESRVVEGTSAGTVTVNLTVSISAPNLTGITSVQWSTREGSAIENVDFVKVNPTLLTWSLGDGSSKLISVQVQSDSLAEWNTNQQDESFFVVLENPVNATIVKPSATVTILDDDHPAVSQRPGVQFLSAVSGSVIPHGVSDGQVRLQWRVPPASPAAINIMVRFNFGPTSCPGGFPPADTAGTFLTSLVPSAGGTTQFTTHTGLNLTWHYCYSVFAQYLGGTSTQIGQIKGTPFSAAGSIAWKFTSPTTILVPPTVGQDAIYVTDTIGVVHALQRTTTGGMWPSTWNPVAVGQTNNRSAVIPRPEGPRLYHGTNSGGLHSVDGRTGSVVWSRNPTNGLALTNLGGAQAQLGGIFKNFGGANDMLLVGTNAAAGSNELYALDPATGNILDAQGTLNMGAVLGMPVVDYAGNRVFFVSASAAETVFAMTLGAAGAPDLAIDLGLTWNPKPAGGSNGSLVLRSDRFYFGDTTNQLYALHMSGVSYSTGTGEGPVKGFVWPDRRNDNLYFATTGKVQGVRDTGTGFINVFAPVSVPSPSMVLQKPSSDFIFVGDGAGNLLQINVLTGIPTTLTLEPGFQIGAPSLDGTHNLVIVGSNTGNVYAVRVPF